MIDNNTTGFHEVVIGYSVGARLRNRDRKGKPWIDSTEHLPTDSLTFHIICYKKRPEEYTKNSLSVDVSSHYDPKQSMSNGCPQGSKQGRFDLNLCFCLRRKRLLPSLPSTASLSASTLHIKIPAA